MNIIICADNNGFYLKKILKKYLLENKIFFNLNNLLDVGTYNTEYCDYPILFQRFYTKFANGDWENTFGILICETGISMSTIANKVNIIRCALCNSVYTAEIARKHNNSNVLALGGKITRPRLAKKILKKFLTTSFEGGVHQKRLHKLIEIISNLN